MTMMDFAMLPPEVNSARMYAGAGSAPMMAAAAAWNQLAAVLNSSAGSYQAVVSQLTDGPWRGPAAASMAAAADPYVAWLHTTATQATQAANQANTAAAAYQEAFAATVPPPLIAANRALLRSLVATNVLGQNAPAIAANQAQYAEMWVQDATAMSGYAAGSAAATTLTPFTAPPQTTDPAGIGAQAGAVGQTAAPAAAASTQTALAGLSQSNPLLDFLNSPLIQGLEQLQQETSGFASGLGGGGFMSAGVLLGGPDWGVQGAIAASQVYAAVTAGTPGLASSVSGGAPGFTLAGSSGSEAAGPAGGGVSAGLGRATPLGGLSVPPSWGMASPGIRLAATALPTAGSAGLAGMPEAGITAPGSWFGGMPPVGSVVNAPRNSGPRVRVGAGSKATPQIAEEAGADEVTQDRQAFAAGTRTVANERDELNRMRRAVAELTKQRDALRRSAASMIREAARR